MAPNQTKPMATKEQPNKMGMNKTHEANMWKPCVCVCVCVPVLALKTSQQNCIHKVFSPKTFTLAKRFIHWHKENAQFQIVSCVYLLYCHLLVILSWTQGSIIKENKMETATTTTQIHEVKWKYEIEMLTYEYAIRTEREREEKVPFSFISIWWSFFIESRFNSPFTRTWNSKSLTTKFTLAS